MGTSKAFVFALNMIVNHEDRYFDICLFFDFNSFSESCIAVCLKQKKEVSKFLRIDRRDTILSIALYDSFFNLSSLFIDF
ncbi:hypothetical protein FF52_22384 [Flavobacterium sp. F52]|nr:hypothetical protein FF52_22384 [Flavobacterium sp. F52]